MTKKAKTGKELERRVANAYRKMGARKVEHDVEMAGNQIDVYVELETTDRSSHRIAIEAKDWKDTVGIDVINKFATIVNLLRSQRQIDEGAIISASGFSKQARNAAREYGLRLLESADLDALVTKVMATGLTNENLLLVQERKSEHVTETDVPLDLITEEQWLKQEIVSLEQQTAHLEAKAVSTTLVQPRMPEARTPEIPKEAIDPAKLRQNIVAHFDRGDMEILCHDLNLPYGNLSRPREDTTALQIVNHCEKRGRLVELLNYCQQKRSHVDWQSIAQKSGDK